MACARGHGAGSERGGAKHVRARRRQEGPGRGVEPGWPGARRPGIGPEARGGSRGRGNLGDGVTGTEPRTRKSTRRDGATAGVDAWRRQNNEKVARKPEARRPQARGGRTSAAADRGSESAKRQAGSPGQAAADGRPRAGKPKAGNGRAEVRRPQGAQPRVGAQARARRRATGGGGSEVAGRRRQATAGRQARLRRPRVAPVRGVRGARCGCRGPVRTGLRRRGV